MSTETAPHVLTVGQLNSQIRDQLSSQFHGIWLAGEISDLSRPRSGHLYFSLKDPTGSIRGICWRSQAARLAFEPEDGMQVLCCGDIDVYPPRGTYQLVVRTMQVQGEGTLQARLRKLQEKLAEEGLFDPSRKRPLPDFPRQIAIVTSISGAALRDFLEVVRRRWSQTRLIVVPSDVQGARAAPQLRSALEACKRLSIDAILVTRGGGSLEDLWAFNDEQVVRSIAAARVPVVSAVGHEIDVTLADLAADVRALTPSEAGERMVPDRIALSAGLTQLRERLPALVKRGLQQARSQLEHLQNSRTFREPALLVQDRVRVVDDLGERCERAARSQLTAAHERTKHAASHLHALSPLAVLARGYAVTQRADNHVVRSATDVQPGEPVRIRLHQGQISATVTECFREDGENHDHTR